MNFSHMKVLVVKFQNYLFEQCDPTPLAIFRILFGFLMFLDVPQERGLEEADYRFGDPNYCFFPLLPGIQPIKLSHACILYSIMWLGSVGIMLGYKFRLSCTLYFFPYVYFMLLDKSRWNNHSYLFGLLVILLAFSKAGTYLSLDDCKKGTQVTVPRWNYAMIKFQLFILYFFAAVKKLDADWLAGYSMKNLTEHWVFEPLKLFVNEETLEFYMIHIGGFTYDLTVGFLLNLQMTKKIAFLLSFMFHGLNSQIFTIGMFPYVCLASLVIFCEPNEFPCSLFRFQQDQTGTKNPSISNSIDSIHSKKNSGGHIRLETGSSSAATPKSCNSRRISLLLMLVYVFIQIFLPFSHFITKGYNNWTQGLYGYSWDMMVYSWKTLHIKVTVKDLHSGTERYLDPDVWVTNDRWSSHADMAKQYSECVAHNLKHNNFSNNVSVHLDVWKSLNGRFQQRVFDPRVDIIQAPWSPWEPVTWLLPLLKEYSHWRREHFQRIAKTVANWTASSNVIFVADFPGLYLENYLPLELSNVTLTLMKGNVIVEQGGVHNKSNTTLSSFDDPDFTWIRIVPGGFHRIYTVSQSPSLYMYTYTNSTVDKLAAMHQRHEPKNDGVTGTESFSYWEDILAFIYDKVDVFARSFYLIFNAYLNVLLDVPMVVRQAGRGQDY